MIWGSIYFLTSVPVLQPDPSDDDVMQRSRGL